MRHALLLACALTLLPVSSHAAEDRVLDIQEVKSASGLSAWLVEDHSVPVISLSFIFKNAGSVRDPAGKEGTFQLLSNTLDEGAGPYSSQEFQKILTDKSISLGFSSGRDAFGGSVKTLTSEKDTAFELLKLALTQPRFDAEPLSRMRAANLSRVRSSLSDPGWIAARIGNAYGFEGHPYANNAGGTLSSLKRITAHDLRKALKDELTKDRLKIAVTGDISPENLAKTIDYVFSDLENTANSPDIADFELKNQGKTYFYALDVPQTTVQMLFPGIGRDNPDYYALQVMNQIFGGGGFGSRLMESIREKQGLTYGIYSGVGIMDHTSIFTVTSATKTDTVGQLIESVNAEMKRMADQPPSQTEIRDAKASILGSVMLGLTSTSSITGMMQSMQSEDLPLDYLDTLRDHVEAVSAADIARVASHILQPKAAMMVIVGQKGEKDTQAYTQVPTLPGAY
ncbi:MAG: M16 family metallopeptidase [Pseudobdellovibrionaceae bacterium]